MDLDDVAPSMSLGQFLRTRYAKPTDAATKSLNLMRDNIEELLEEPWRKNFVNTANTIMRLGNKNVKMVKPRRQKLREIIANNLHVAKLYNEYAAKHAETEKRVTYHLPVFADLEQQDQSKEGNQQGEDEKSQQQDKDEGHEQKDGDGGDIEEQQNGGEGEVMQDEDDTREAISKAFMPPNLIAEGKIEGLAAEQIQQALDKGTEAPQANMTGNTQESTDHNINEHEIGADTETMSIDVLPRPIAQDAQRRHVHFAPEATLSQEQPDTAVELTKTVDIEVEPPPKKAATKAVQFIMNTSQPVSLGLTRIQVTPVSNPEAFPIERMQVVQAQYYPSATIVNVFTHRDPSGEVIRVTADMQDGPVNHFSIHDVRIITALGLRDGDGDKMNIDESALKMNETFTITMLPNQRVKNLNNFVVGELKSARHAYLHWLDYRGCADPTCPPFVQEARTIAVRLGRRAHDVWKEIDGYWQLEQGNGGKQHRKNRLKYLGEDLRYEVNVKERRVMQTMWG